MSMSSNGSHFSATSGSSPTASSLLSSTASAPAAATPDKHVGMTGSYQKSSKPSRSWIALKRLQYEYTFGVFMMEPWEKRVFDAAIVLFVGLFGYAIWHYAPGAAHNLVARSTFYVAAPEAS
ncbi:hypothetical protein HKX48_003042 [Thoreauomyces humboldtii]|nr:hypothetical protein HKX48_003042 [Thoreauomyces humboldtii]